MKKSRKKPLIKLLNITAIAFATSIAYGICPCNLIFYEKQMRKHLIDIFLSRQLKMFPILQNKSNNCIRQTMVYSKREIIVYDHFGDQTEQFINFQNFINHYDKTVSSSNKTIIKETIDLVYDDLLLGRVVDGEDGW